jgi:hypothetical protein
MAPYQLRVVAKRHGLGVLLASLVSRCPSRAPHAAFVDMTDRRVRNVTVDRRAENQANGNAAWFVRCDAGHEFVVQGIALRDAEKNHRDVACPDCPATGGARKRAATLARRRVLPTGEYVPSGMARANASCSVCGESTHTRMRCPKRAGARSKYCGECSGLAHRRPPGGCPECGEPFVPERMPTLPEVVAGMRAPSREVNF